MIQRLSENKLPLAGLLLASSGVIDAIIAILYFYHADHPFHASRSIVFLGELTVAAGACIIAAAIYTSRNNKHWLLMMLNGLACSTLGLIFTFWKGPLAFRTVALLVVVMAISIGIYELATARTLGHLIGEWLLGAAGLISVVFALLFLAFVFSWIRLQPASPGQSLGWLGSYFGFCAICTLGLALRLYLGFPHRGPAAAAPMAQ